MIAGELRGRTLRTPPGRQIRPTQGHVRQVLFDILGSAITGARVLDFFAGVGALGIEALSRGAAEACFVERDPTVLRYLRENLEELGLTERGRVLGVSVEVACRILESEPEGFRWIVADPPYHLEPERWVRRATRGGPGVILAPEGTLILETSRRQVKSESIGRLRRFRSHTVGETVLDFYGWEGTDGTKGDLSGDL